MEGQWRLRVSKDAIDYVLAIRAVALEAWMHSEGLDARWALLVVDAADALAFKLKLWQQYVLKPEKPGKTKPDHKEGGQ